MKFWTHEKILEGRDLGINVQMIGVTLYTSRMGKLVKKSELIALGTLGIILFSSTHFPALLSVLDATSSPETYTATAAAPYEDAAIAPEAGAPTATSVETINAETSTASTTPSDEAIFTPRSSDASITETPDYGSTPTIDVSSENAQ